MRRRKSSRSGCGTGDGNIPALQRASAAFPESRIQSADDSIPGKPGRKFGSRCWRSGSCFRRLSSLLDIVSNENSIPSLSPLQGWLSPFDAPLDAPPTACAVGCILSPLRGARTLAVIEAHHRTTNANQCPGIIAVLMSPPRFSMWRRTCCRRDSGASPVM